jgi:hypothetical protein
MKTYGAGTNYNNDWKLINIQIGSRYPFFPIIF